MEVEILTLITMSEVFQKEAWLAQTEVKDIDLNQKKTKSPSIFCIFVLFLNEETAPNSTMSHENK